LQLGGFVGKFGKFCAHYLAVLSRAQRKTKKNQKKTCKKFGAQFFGVSLHYQKGVHLPQITKVFCDMFYSFWRFI